MNNYRNAFTEVYTILNYLDEEEYNKIPENILEVISSNRNTEYHYDMDENLDLRNHSMLPETKAILFNLFRDYLSTPKQKEIIIRMQREERLKNEAKKREKFDVDVFKSSKKEASEETENETIEPNQEEKSVFKVISNHIKNFLN